MTEGLFAASGPIDYSSHPAAQTAPDESHETDSLEPLEDEPPKFVFSEDLKPEDTHVDGFSDDDQNRWGAEMWSPTSPDSDAIDVIEIPKWIEDR